MLLMGCVESVTALHCVICLSCYNDSIISCCLGNRHICSATLSLCHAQVLCAHVCTGECMCLCAAQQKENRTLMNDKSIGQEPGHANIKY